MKVYIGTNAIELACDLFFDLKDKENIAIEQNSDLEMLFEEISQEDDVKKIFSLSESVEVFPNTLSVKETFFETIDVAILTLKADGSLLNNVPNTSFDLLFNENDGTCMGLKKILQARHIIVLAYGDELKDAVLELTSGVRSEAFPASILFDSENVSLVIDQEAAKLI